MQVCKYASVQVCKYPEEAVGRDTCILAYLHTRRSSGSLGTLPHLGSVGETGDGPGLGETGDGPGLVPAMLPVTSSGRATRVLILPGKNG